MKLLLENWREYLDENNCPPEDWGGTHPTFRGKLPEPGPYYHGTSTALDIRDELLPPTMTGKQTEPRAQRRGKVFFTNSLISAKHYAKIAVNQWGGEPVIYRIEPAGPIKQISSLRSNKPDAHLYGPAFHACGAEVLEKISLEQGDNNETPT